RARRVRDVPAPAVVDRDIHFERRVAGSLRHRGLHAVLQVGGKGAEIADEAQADVVAVEFVDLVRERAEEQLLQRADFAGGAFPVFAGEGEQGQRTDPAAAAELDARTHRLLSRAVAERARPAT